MIAAEWARVCCEAGVLLQWTDTEHAWQRRARELGAFDEADGIAENIFRAWERTNDLACVIALWQGDDFAKMIRIQPDLQALARTFREDVLWLDFERAKGTAKEICRRMVPLWA